MEADGEHRPTFNAEGSRDMVTDKLKILANAMQAYTWRAQATTSNLANLDTPGYERHSISFEESLQEARGSVGGSEAMAAVRPSLEVDGAAPILEDELMEMADTQMRIQLASRALREHFDTLRMGITGHSG